MNNFTVIYNGEYSIIESQFIDADIMEAYQICDSFSTWEEAAAYIDKALNL